MGRGAATGRRCSSDALLLACLIGALAGFQLVLAVDRLSVVFVVDLSDLGRGRPGARRRSRSSASRSRRCRTATSRASSRSASDSLVERLPSDVQEVDRIASTPIQDATDIGAALRLAGRALPR